MSTPEFNPGNESALKALQKAQAESMRVSGIRNFSTPTKERNATTFRKGPIQITAEAPQDTFISHLKVAGIGGSTTIIDTIGNTKASTSTGKNKTPVKVS